MATHLVYRFYAELEDYKPKIWRRFEVNGNKTIAELGYILMTMFEMQASHLFCLTYDAGAEILAGLRQRHPEEEVARILGKGTFAECLKVWRFELPSEDAYEHEIERLFDARQYRLRDLSREVPLRLRFSYDYGDDWQVRLTLESCEKIEIHASELPKVLAGAGFGIVEDCGGVGGLKELAKAFRKKKGRQYAEYREWLGVDDLDLATFNIEDVNFRLKKLPRIFKECYEYGYKPTQRSIDLIERKYLRDK
jgi:hypothetical protein